MQPAFFSNTFDKKPSDKYKTISMPGNAESQRRKTLIESSFLKNENSTRTRDNSLID